MLPDDPINIEQVRQLSTEAKRLVVGTVAEIEPLLDDPFQRWMVLRRRRQVVKEYPAEACAGGAQEVHLGWRRQVGGDTQLDRLPVEMGHRRHHRSSLGASPFSSLAHRSRRGPSSGSTWLKNWLIALPGCSRATVKDAPATFMADTPAPVPRLDNGLRDVGVGGDGDGEVGVQGAG
jgi:hypothetical protein